MVWKHYKGSHRTTINMQNGQSYEATIEIGTLLTGKSRMHSGYYCRIVCGEFDEYSEASSIFQAVHLAICNAIENGFTINIYAMRPDFYESGLSADTGWGYVNDIKKPVLMIDQIGVVRECTSTSKTKISRRLY